MTTKEWFYHMKGRSGPECAVCEDMPVLPYCPVCNVQYLNHPYFEKHGNLSQAAPDLYAALTAIIAEQDRYGEENQKDDYLTKNARAALAKARGEQKE